MDKRDDSDNEISGNESEHSNSSHENEAVRESAGYDPDSDDSSEMDEAECDNRRNSLLQHVQDLQSQFGLLREKLYQERISQVESQLSEVKSGKSPEDLVSLTEHEENMRIRIEVAGILRKLRIKKMKHQYRSEKLAAMQNFENDKSLAYDYHYNEIMDAIRQLEEDRHNTEIDWGEGGAWGSKSSPKPKKKAVAVSGPYIVYMLKPEEILEDWNIIKKAQLDIP